MNVMVLGSGARENAILWKLGESPLHPKLFAAPGNRGTAPGVTQVPVNPEDIGEVARAVREYAVDFVVVGPEQPLANGVVDHLTAHGIPVFGPTKEAVRIETDKWEAAQIMDRTQVPHPKTWKFLSPRAAVRFARSCAMPLVVKTPGLAQGRGSAVCGTLKEVEQTVAEFWKRYRRMPILLQEFVRGREVSAFAFCDGWNLSPLAAACDYKRLLDGDRGPNTGGMGSYAWPEFWTCELASWVMQYIMKPVVRRLWREGTPFVGMLYAGLMVPEDGHPQVLEFNARFGDPEAQVILPLLGTDLLEVMGACLEGTLDELPVKWDASKAAVGVVLASDSYPDKGVHELVLHKEDFKLLDQDLLVFPGNPRGRALTLVAVAESCSTARAQVYKNIDRVPHLSNNFRRDIANLQISQR